MVSVMKNDFDLERNPVAEKEPRVSDDENVRVVDSREGKMSDLDVKEETRVSTRVDMCVQKSEIDEIRVSDGPGQEGDGARVLDEESSNHVNGDSGGLDRARVSPANEGVRNDVKTEEGVQDGKPRDSQSEGVKPEPCAINSRDDQIRGMDTSDSPSASSSDATGDDGTRLTHAHKHEGLVEDAANHEFRLEKRSDSQASMSDDSASNLGDFVPAGSMKVLGSQFEMGDMVWGKVKSHPWWPGHIYNEAFATNSVRRSRRDGHVLVAFFGDSSYGWFDLTELIPYEPYFAEKSQQTFSRNFMNAVEESVDEASRRSALGLSCRCRNPHNFRPTNVPGYMAVDVVDYEPGAIYSVSQIQKARESFQPAETLLFIKMLAAAPMTSETNSFDFIRHKATALAYRGAIFEEFDETYAQAFGQQPVRPSPSSTAPTDKEPSRAPLSGPLVMAEALGGKKSSNKATKPKDPAKKDKYLFKRRDESGNLRTTGIGQVHKTLSSSSAYGHETSDSAAASYVFQKRDQVVPNFGEHSGAPAMDPAISAAGPGSLPQQSESGIAKTTVGSDVHGQVPDSRTGVGSSTDGGLVKKKKKTVKRPATDLNSEKPDRPVKKMKKLKKTDCERALMHLDTQPFGSGGVFKPAVKPVLISASSREKKDVEASDYVPKQAGLVPSTAAEETVYELAELLGDLLGLALNPFHGAERNRPAIVRQFFLKFRSLVFLKSSSASPPPESEPDARAIRSPPAAEADDRTPTESRKMKQSKPSARHDDSTKGGRKRIPSERQEEIAAKRAKKFTDVKSLAAEKKALSRNPEMPQVDAKPKAAAGQQSSSRLTKTEQHLKKADRPPRVEEPTYLVMRFQSGSSLPSLMELKARFARFGPLDTSLSRVFYKTNTCRVAFLYKQDANVAYRYAVGNKSVFANVKFMLKPVAAPEPQQQPTNGKPEDLNNDPFSNRDSLIAEPRLPPVSALPLLPLQPPQQLKSCLKKPSGNDEPGPPNNGAGAMKTTRVRFNMGEDKGSASNRSGVQQMQVTDSRNTNLSSESGPSSSSSSSSVAMDTVSNNQRFISSHPLQPPLLPTPPPQYLRPPGLNLPRPHHLELSSRDNRNYNASTPPSQQAPSPPSIDISQQMMSLLTRCHELVTNVKSVQGHVPYHTL